MTIWAKIQLRRTLTWVVPLATVAAFLGLLAATAVHASCVGPSLRLTGSPTIKASPNTPAVGPGFAYLVRPATTIDVQATDVFDSSAGCNDTPAGGCSAPPPEPGPAKDLSLVLIQGSRQWVIARGDASGADPSISWEIVLPGDLEAGSAELRLRGPTIITETYLRLRVRT